MMPRDGVVRRPSKLDRVAFFDCEVLAHVAGSQAHLLAYAAAGFGADLGRGFVDRNPQRLVRVAAHEFEQADGFAQLGRIDLKVVAGGHAANTLFSHSSDD